MRAFERFRGFVFLVVGFGVLSGFLLFTAAGTGGETDPPPLVITNATLIPEGMLLSGSGGSSDGEYQVLSTSDLAVPVTNWPAVSTNFYDADGTFISTNPVAPGVDHAYYVVLDNGGPDFGLVGWATVSGDTTGGAGGPTQTVSTAAAFISAVSASGPRVVQVQGTIEFNGGIGSASISSDKTVLGLGTNATVIGQLSVNGVTNVIIRNLFVSNTGDPSTVDGVRIYGGADHVWVDHCTFTDCSDGEVDITQASDYITVSWCKFNYVDQTEHNFVNLIAGSDTDAGDYRITFHHNWWSTGCKQRMPASRYGTVHLFNNYYNVPNNDYCSNARTNAQFLSENNYYANVDDPIYKVSNGRIQTSGNIYENCTGRIDSGTDTVFTPPYAYALDPTQDAPSIVTEHAGAARGPFLGGP